MRLKKYIDQQIEKVAKTTRAQYAYKYFDKYNVDYFENTIQPQLEKKCKPFLREFSKVFKHDFLWRGTKVAADMAEKIVRKDRQPRDIPYEIQEILDSLFEEKFGWKARSNSAFASAGRNNVILYGHPHIFIPVGRYDYIWASSIADLYDFWNNALSSGVKMTAEEYIEELKTRVVNKYEKNKGLGMAIQKEHEIMFHCKSYFVIKEIYREILSIYFKNLKI